LKEAVGYQRSARKSEEHSRTFWLIAES